MLRPGLVRLLLELGFDLAPMIYRMAASTPINASASFWPTCFFLLPVPHRPLAPRHLLFDLLVGGNRIASIIYWLVFYFCPFFYRVFTEFWSKFDLVVAELILTLLDLISLILTHLLFDLYRVT